MTSLVVNDTPEGSTVTIDAENRLVDLDRPSNFRYTKESQNFLHSGDTGFDRVASLQDKQIVWGSSHTGSGSINDGGGSGRNRHSGGGGGNGADRE